jgi:hypothetical protein
VFSHRELDAFANPIEFQVPCGKHSRKNRASVA